MILLSGYGESLKISSGSTASTDWAVSWNEVSSSSCSQFSRQGNLASVTDVEVVPSPDPGVVRIVSSFSVVNRASSVSQTITVKKVASGSSYHLTPSISLGPGESLQYHDGRGWYVLTTPSGSVKTYAVTSDPELNAIASVTSAADLVPYFTGSGTASTFSSTSYGRSVVAWADAASGRSALGLGSLATLSTVGTSQIDNDSVTYAKIQNVSATDKVLGRASAGSGDVEEIPCTAAGRALLDDADSAAQRTTLGLGGLATLSSVGTSQINDGSVTYIKIQNISATDKLLGRVSAGAGVVEEVDFTDAGQAMVAAASHAAQTALLSVMSGDSGSGGVKGLVPAPSAGDAAAGKFLKADGTWSTPPGSGSSIGRTEVMAMVSLRI